MDLTVFIDGLKLIPFRFPIPFLFTLLGVYLGFCYTEKKYKSILIVLLFIFTSLIAFQKLFLPYQLYKNYGFNIPKNVSIANFNEVILLNSNHEKVRLSEIINNDLFLIDLYFNECSVCLKKEKVLKKLKEQMKEKINIILICDGRLNTFDEFKHRIQKEKKNNKIELYYLYDSESSFKKIFNFNGYPFEILILNKKIIKILNGYDTKIQNKYLQDRINLSNIN
jgi:hypothetical protein